MRLLARPLPDTPGLAPRRLLDRGWAVCAQPAAQAGDQPPADDAAGWLHIDAAEPAAAALQAAGRWSLNGAPRRFDADVWWYRLRFDADEPAAELAAGLAADAAGGPATLGFDGLATLAEVRLNGEPILHSRNMFRGHQVDVSGRLRARGNELLLRFDSLDAQLAQRRPRPRWRAPMVEHAQLRWFRCTLLGRTPGWSPPAAVVGPWQPVWLAAHGAPGSGDATPRIAGLRLHSQLVGSSGRLDVRLRVAGVPPRRARVQLARGSRVWQCVMTPQRTPQRTPPRPNPSTIPIPAAPTATGLPPGASAPATATAAEMPWRPGDSPAADGEWIGTIDVPAVERWWPHTHGEPALYALRLVLEAEDGGGAPVTLPLGQVGFRSVVVDRGADGSGFGLVVNDEPVFARGACWTPLDSLRLHTDAARYQAVIAQVKAAGMNLLRVGGTMVYESDAFFDACDAAGVMVWQDLMFASMDYPADDPAFIEDVDAELAEQLTRLQARPAVVLVCGNSEVEQQAAMAGAPRELWAPPLFHAHIPARVAEHLPGAAYWPSSAHGGAFPFQPAAGTASYYGVGAYRRGIDDAAACGLRFASECLAFANVPDAAALERAAAAGGVVGGGAGSGASLRVHQPAWKARVPRDLGAGWDFDDVRDHYVEQLFGEGLVGGRADALRASDPARHLALGRAASAQAMHAAFTRWRSEGSACRGALVWFLRDLWPGAGWGVLDDEVQPKAAFHALARVLQPLHVGITDDGLNGLHLQLVNEAAQPVDGELELALYRHGETLLARQRRALTLPPRSTRRQSVVDWLPGFTDLSWAYRFGPPAADLLVATLYGADGGLLRRTLHAAPGTMAAPNGDIGLRATAQPQADGRVRLRASSRAAAYGVHVEAHGWRASDAFFHLPPGGEHAVDFTPLPGARRHWRATIHALNGREPVVVGTAGGDGSGSNGVSGATPD